MAAAAAVVAAAAAVAATEAPNNISSKISATLTLLVEVYEGTPH